jgi:hypothetical protein
MPQNKPTQSAIAAYLCALVMLCFEVSRHPELLPVFPAALQLVPATVTEFAARRRWRHSFR